MYNASNGIMSFSTFYFTTVHFLSPYSRPVSVHGSSLYLIICLFCFLFFSRLTVNLAPKF